MAGMFTRIAAISIPGTILSQLGTHTIPSNWCDSTIDSTASATNSREGSEYFMPLCPMAIPSQMAMVLNSKGHATRLADRVLDHPGKLL